MRLGDVCLIASIVGLNNHPDIGTPCIVTDLFEDLDQFNRLSSFIRIKVLSGQYSGYYLEYYDWRLKPINGLVNGFKEILLS